MKLLTRVVLVKHSVLHSKMVTLLHSHENYLEVSDSFYFCMFVTAITNGNINSALFKNLEEGRLVSVHNLNQRLLGYACEK